MVKNMLRAAGALELHISLIKRIARMCENNGLARTANSLWRVAQAAADELETIKEDIERGKVR